MPQIKLIANVCSEKRQSERNYTRSLLLLPPDPVLSLLANAAKNSSRFSLTYSQMEEAHDRIW